MSTGITKRIIACLDVTNGRVVKGVQFVDLIDAGDPSELAHLHATSGADEIVLLDITATSDARPILIDVVRRTARQLFVPFTVGGGVRSLADASALFDAGADKISINSAAIKSPRSSPKSPSASAPRPSSSPSTPSASRMHPSPPEAPSPPRSISPEAASPPAATPSSGRARPNPVAAEKSCSPRWTATAPAPASIVPSPQPCQSR